MREHHHITRQPRHFGDGMADIDDRDLRLVAQPLDIGQDLALARLVERGERLVHQEELRAGKQRTADRHTLLFAARQFRRPPVEEMADAEQVDHGVDIGVAFGGRREPAAIAQIAGDAQMREEPRVLEHHADPPLVHRHDDAGGGVDQHAAFDRNAPLLRPDQSGNQVDQRRLARTRRPEQRRQPTGAFEIRFDEEIAEAMIDVDRERHSMSIRRPTRRARTSEATSATIEMTIEISVSRSAPASPPGTCVKV